MTQVDLNINQIKSEIKPFTEEIEFINHLELNVFIGALVNYVELDVEDEKNKKIHDRQMRNIVKWIHPLM